MGNKREIKRERESETYQRRRELERKERIKEKLEKMSSAGPVETRHETDQGLII